MVSDYTTTNNEGKVFDGWGREFRARGLDEIAQLNLVRSGIMSVVGPRPLMPQTALSEYVESNHIWTKERILDEMDVAFHNDWLEAVNNGRPGIFSSFGIHNHTQPLTSDTSNIRAELDIRDFRDASLRRDVLIVKTIAMVSLRGEQTIPEPLRHFAPGAEGMIV